MNKQRKVVITTTYNEIGIIIDTKAEELGSSAQLEVIRCREGKFASGDSRICMKFGHSPIGELDFCAWAERIPNEREDTIRAGDGAHEDRH